MIILAEGEAAWTGVIGAVVNIGFSAIVGWYLLTKAMPKQTTEFTATIDALQKGFFAALEKRDTVADVRETRGQTEAKAALAAVLTHCEKESERRDLSFRQEMALVQAAIKDQREIMEDSRDVLRDLSRELLESERRKRTTGEGKA